MFEGVPDYRRKQGRRHSLPLCLALFTLAAVKGNQPKLYQAVQEKFVAQETFSKVNKGHGRIEKRKVSTYAKLIT